MSSEDRTIEFVSAFEEAGISRKLLAWLNKWLAGQADVPFAIDFIDYEFMEDETPGMAMSLVQSAYIVERFIDGTYTADYPFKIIYRTAPGTPEARLGADELLDALAQWAAGQTPDIGDGLEVQEIEQVTPSTLFARMAGGWEDHQIFMRMTYTVHPGK